MSDKSKIEWCDATWNCVRGCTKISPGCKHCYASTFAERFRGVKGHPYEQGFDLRLVPDKLDAPLHWKKPRRIFVNSMSDLFHEDVPDEFIAAVFGVMAACPQHAFQILTKRAERLPRWFEWLKRGTPGHMHGPIGAVHEAMSYGGFDKLSFRAWDRMVAIRKSEHGEPASIGDATAWPWPLPNVWLGVSVEDQKHADERIPHLLRTPAAVRFLSCEPLLGPVDLSMYLFDELPFLTKGNLKAATKKNPFVIDTTAIKERVAVASGGLHWVIAGGESGPGARPMDVEWVRSIRDQCSAACVALFVKQLGAFPTATLRHEALDATWKIEPGGALRMVLKDRAHGGDPAEWPEDLRIRQFPMERR